MAVQSIKADIKTVGVRDVVDLCGELEFDQIGQVPALGERRVDIEDTVSAKVVTLPGFTRIGKPNRVAKIDACVDGGDGSRSEDMRGSIHEVFLGRDVADIKSGPLYWRPLGWQIFKDMHLPTGAD